jgi:ATP-binding cassette subfamily C protein
LADLIIGLFRPESGQVSIDDIPVTDLSLKAWRSMISYAPQETIMFHDTILTNVTLGDPALSRADAEKALRAAGSWDFVTSLTEGLDWIVGEKGARLSGGGAASLLCALSFAVLAAYSRRGHNRADPQTKLRFVTPGAIGGKVTIIAIRINPRW